MSGANEFVARAVLKAYLGRALRYEYVVPGSGVRADAIDVTLESIDGWEIKTAVDSVKRLAGQVQGYQQYFDRCWLFAAPKRAAVELPSWWGLVTFEAEAFPEFDWSGNYDHAGYRSRFADVVAGATVTVVRDALPSPRQDARSLWATMWAGERKAVLVALDDHPSKHWQHERITSRLSVELARWTLVNRDPAQYPFSKARARWWAAQVAGLVGLEWAPPAPLDPGADGVTEFQPSLFAEASA